MTSSETTGHLRPTRAPRVLVVGAKPRGQVLAHLLRAGGADVDVLMDPNEIDAARRGFDIHQYGIFGYREYTTFIDFDGFCVPERAAEHPYAQVWFLLDSVREHREMVEGLAAIHPAAPFVTVDMDPGDLEFLAERLDRERVVTGTVPMIVYPAPLPGESLTPPGVAYWLAPRMPILFGGDRADEVVALLSGAEVATEASTDVEAMIQFNAALSLPLALTLSLHNWSLDQTRRSSMAMRHLPAAIDELLRTVARSSGREIPKAHSVAIHDWVWKVALFAVGHVAPFPVQPYVEQHFRHRWEFSDDLLKGVVRRCIDHGVQPKSFGALYDEWADQRDRAAIAAKNGAAKSTATSDVPLLSAPVVDDDDDDETEWPDLPVSDTGALQIGAVDSETLEEDTDPPELDDEAASVPPPIPDDSEE